MSMQADPKVSHFSMHVQDVEPVQLICLHWMKPMVVCLLPYLLPHQSSVYQIKTSVLNRDPQVLCVGIFDDAYSQTSLSGCLISFNFALSDPLVATSAVYVRRGCGLAKRPNHCKPAVFSAPVGDRLSRFDCNSLHHADYWTAGDNCRGG